LSISDGTQTSDRAPEDFVFFAFFGFSERKAMNGGNAYRVFDCFRDYIDTKGLRRACLIVEGAIKAVVIVKDLRDQIFSIQTSY
jgi:hypothetical protein